MAFGIIFSPEAEEHLDAFTARNRRTLLDRVSVQLRHEPNVSTRHRKQLQLQPASLAAWELRVGDFRVFYDVDLEQLRVYVIAVGMKKHNILTIAGEEIEL